jgi:hypothetical protein
MNTQRIDAIEQEIEDATVILLASEGWAESWNKSPEQFKQLLRLEAKLERACRDYLRKLSTEITNSIDWQLYNVQKDKIQAAVAKLQADDEGELAEAAAKIVAEATLEMIDDPQDAQITSVNLEVAIREIYINGVALGYAAEVARLRKAGMLASTISETLESAITERLQAIADDHLGILADYLDETTAANVVDMMQESLALGESDELAAKRLKRYIDDPKRAELVAQTEMPRTYGLGEQAFAKANGASSKTWEALPGADGGGSGPCTDNDGETVGIDDEFPSGHQHNPAHPRCRCHVYYDYPADHVIQILA